MDIDTEAFRIRSGEPLDLATRPTRVEPVYDSKKHYRKLLRGQVKQLSKRQEALYASNTYALLLIFQAMDTAGKDGAIRHVMSGVNPQGTQVTSFKHPSATELEHDFLWRTSLQLPERGHIGIFNRSYYEEVLVVQVHPEILQAQNLPRDLRDNGDVWESRYRSILDHERHLTANGTRIVKFFLHISPEEQRRRLLARLEDPAKHWKFSPSDLEERGYWDEYMHAYARTLSATSTDFAPWYAIPADDKKNARLHIARVILETIESLHVEPPGLSPAQHHDLEKARKRLAGEA